MNAIYGFTLLDVLLLHQNGTLEMVEIDRLRDYQDLLLWQIDATQEYIESGKATRIQRIYFSEDLRLFRRVSDEIAAILTTEFYAKAI
jgi:hypothetical protein